MTDSRDPTTSPSPAYDDVSQRPRFGRLHRIGCSIAAMFVLYLMCAYLVMPWDWKRYAHLHPAVDETPNITQTSDHHPGDPINVALIGNEAEFVAMMLGAGWFRADALGLKSDLKIAADTVLKRPYDEAPVSNLYFWGRKQDLAFEQPVGDNPRHRHHVRFWKSDAVDAHGLPLWAGSATYDMSVGLSHTTGQITHHIASDIDNEREHLFNNLEQTGDLIDIQYVDNFHEIKDGRNGGGDPWHTDGRLKIGSIQASEDSD